MIWVRQVFGTEETVMNATGTKAYRVLVADDHAVVRRGTRDLISQQPGVEVCGEAATGPETIEAVKKGKPNLIILDLTMPEMNGLDVARTLREESPETDVMILSMHFSDELAREVLRTGALAYVLKTDADKELLAAVDHVRHGEPFFTGRLSAAMMRRFLDNSGGVVQMPKDGVGLTRRETDVVQMLADISTRTVESHRNHIMRKLGLTSFSELVRFAVRNNLIEA